jgi:hypothetical protein
LGKLHFPKRYATYGFAGIWYATTLCYKFRKPYKIWLTADGAIIRNEKVASSIPASGTKDKVVG